MIRSFKDKEAEKVFKRELSGKLPNDLQRMILRKLRMLNRSTNINDLRVPPANRLKKLKGDRTGQYSIRINDQTMEDLLYLAKQRCFRRRNS